VSERRIRFRCIVCGAVYTLEEIKYPDWEKYRKPKEFFIEQYKHPQHQISLERAKEEEFYHFTVCHGIFTLVEEA